MNAVSPLICFSRVILIELFVRGNKLVVERVGVVWRELAVWLLAISRPADGR